MHSHGAFLIRESVSALKRADAIVIRDVWRNIAIPLVILYFAKLVQSSRARARADPGTCQNGERTQSRTVSYYARWQSGRVGSTRWSFEDIGSRQRVRAPHAFGPPGRRRGGGGDAGRKAGSFRILRQDSDSVGSGRWARARTLRGHRGWVCDVAVGAGRNLAVSGSWDNMVRVWDFETGVFHCHFQLRRSGVFP